MSLAIADDPEVTTPLPLHVPSLFVHHEQRKGKTRTI
jgi:hypothetical protein